MKSKHAEINCDLCAEKFTNEEELINHKQPMHTAFVTESNDEKVIVEGIDC